MRNFLKRSERSNRSRRPNRGVHAFAASVASAALVFGLGGYPVEAQDRAVSETQSPVTSVAESDVIPGAVESTRNNGVDVIEIEDPDGSAWGFGAKASGEDIFALKRTGQGQIAEILKFTADGKDLDPEFYGYVNGSEGGYIAFDLDALDTIPPRLVEIEVRTSGEASYAIAESDEVPTARELSASGYGRPARAHATVIPDGVGQARIAQQSNSTRRVSTGSLTYSQVRAGRPPRGKITVPITGTRVRQNLYLTEIVIRHNNATANYGITGPIVIRKLNRGGAFNNESCTIGDASIRRVELRPNGVARQVSLDLSGCDLAVWEGDGNSLEIEFTGPGTGSVNTDYAVEVYANTAQNTKPTPPSNFKYPNQRVAVCSGVPATLYPVSGFRLDPNKEFNYEIKSVDAKVLQLYTNYGNSLSNKPSDGTPRPKSVTFDTLKVEGKSAQGHFSSQLNEFSTLDPRYPGDPLANTLCVGIAVDADVQLVNAQGEPQVNIGEYIRLIPEQATSTEPLGAPARQQVLPGWDQPTQKNPSQEAKCGQNIAIVLDASNSVIQANGIDEMADSALRIIDSLEGTGTSVGLYNFGSHSPRFEGAQVSSSFLNDKANADRVRAGVEAYRTGLKDVDFNQTRNQGSTNWEAALKSIKNSGVKYDTVYFITDGFPTYSDAGTGKTGGAEGPGAGMVHVSDITRAMNVADELKKQGTVIQPVLVNIDPKFREPVARDTTVGINEWHDYYNANQRFPSDTYVIWGELGTFVGNTIANQAIDFYQMRQFVTLGQGYGDLLASSISPQPQPDHTRKIVDGQAQLDERDWSTWAVGSRTAEEIGNTIGDNNAKVVQNFSDLNSVLSKLALKNCAGTVSLSKSIVDTNGNLVTVQPKLDGWSFEASTLGPNLVTNGAKLTTVQQITDNNGSLTFDLDFEVPTQSVPVSIREIPQDGYALFPRGDQNAVCRVSSVNKPGTAEVKVVNLDQGFKVDAMSGQIITCSVANQEKPPEPEPRAQLRIAKVAHEVDKLGNLAEGAPLEGAKFKLEHITGEGATEVELKQGESTNLLEASDLALGHYRLTETQSPSGYALLVEPVEFELSRDSETKAVQMTMAEGSTHVAVKPLLDEKQPNLAVLTVANVRQGNLPKTGGVGLQLPILLGGALIAAGALMGRRRLAA